MFRFLLFSALLAVYAAPLPAPLPPTGPWTVEGEENLCMLGHAFGEGAEKVTIGFQPLFLDAPLEMFVLKPDRFDAQYIGQATVTFTPGGAAVKGRYFSVSLPKKDLRMFRLTLASDTLDRLEGAEEIAINAPPLRTVVRLPKAAGKALVTLKACQADLLRSWGVDPAALDPGHAPRMHGNPARYFGPGDYPKQALDAGVYGRVVSVLQVDPSGAVQACRVVASAGTALNDVTCRNARRIVFSPAHDAANKPIASIYMLAVRWTLPGAPD